MLKRTTQQSTTATVADLLRAMTGRFAVTITYAKPEETSIRTIEIHDVLTSKDGRIIVLAADRGGVRTFHPEKIDAYTLLHRVPFTMAPPAGYDRPVPVPRSTAQVVALELGRDDWSGKPLARAA
ncbi:WYL domain-containing protein [Actinacidiphila reveromycinica]|uniref:WYL domain-containing protein n=1 Tax=Actinacidiphila reveromycinica TaxID=659352 RepID=UPI0019217502|nr:WYL domain-containing protein [Streptomyces sp. SN-593]